MSVNDHRKCAKCGKTRDEDKTVSYHRFPMPGKTNTLKARAWATYCWPDQDWTLEQSLQTLYTSHKVLCGRHFSSSQFYDSHRQKLSRFAVPDSKEVAELLQNKENLYVQNEEQSNTNVSKANQGETLQKLTPFKSIQVQPSTSASAGQSSLPSSVLEPEFRKQTAETEPKKASHRKKRGGILRDLDVTKINELSSREVKLYQKCKKHLKEIMRLRANLKRKKLKHWINTLAEDENVQQLSNLNISSSFALLLQSQLQNCPKKPKGRRYSLKQKIMALVIYKKSPACYRLLRRMFALPSQSSLNKLLNNVPLRPGINKHIFTSLKEMTQNQTDEQTLCILSFDEMSIRKHLQYNSKLDEIQGYQDHGNHGRSGAVANKALVFMLSGLRAKWKQPIAFYLSYTLNADRLTVILKEILQECFKANLNVMATVCDLSTVNLKVIRTLGASSTNPYFKINEHEIVTILDPPHLLKCTRNLFLKHNIECTTDLKCDGSFVKGIAKWSHLVDFYQSDKNNPIHVYATKLTDSHLKPNAKQQMKVSLAAQIFSNTVSGGILAKISSGEIQAEAHATATLLRKFDRLFDALNADTPDLRGGKKYSTNMTATSPHLELFKEMKEFIKNMKYLGSRSNPPSQEGWIHTLNAIERLWKNLQQRNIYSLSTRRLNQDPLENFFGCVRYNCGSNDNPTIVQFVAGIKTAIISNLRHTGRNKNCEDDNGIIYNNLTKFLIVDLNSEKSDINIQEMEDKGLGIEGTLETEEIECILADVIEGVENITSESQACAYVCGFIFKKFPHSCCQSCRNAILVNSPEAIHIFTSFKEYDEGRQSLNYVNQNMIICIQIMANIVMQYLETASYHDNLRLKIMSALDRVDFSFLYECEIHFEINKNHLKNSVFCIYVKRFTTIKNRMMEDEEKQRALERKLRILRNK